MTPAEKFELDMFYIQNQSFKMDMQILFRTVWVVVSGNGAR
jgi:lipopolysaccharide/colanic/teichoic acid biosynthesis glycosyltransferase